MLVAKFKNPESARVELESGESLFTIIRDPENKLAGYAHSFNAVMDAIQRKESLKTRQWWLLPGDVLRLPALPPDAGHAVQAAPRHSYHFQLTRVPQIIDVYIGFMDEEVNARLNGLFQKEMTKGDESQQRPIILIERGKIEPGKPILEWRMGNYPIGGKKSPVRKIVHVSPQGEMSKWVKKEDEKCEKRRESVNMPTNLKQGWFFRKKRLRKWADKQKESFDPEDIIARAMGVYMQSDLASDLTWLARGLKVKKYFDIIKMLQHRGKSSTKSKLPDDATGDGPWLSVARFDVGDNTLAPIVVIRMPEMGLQPSLMCPYLAFLFKALSAASSQFAAIEAEQRGAIVRAKGGWAKSENTDKGELWEDVKEGEKGIYKEDKKLKKWPIWEWPLRVSQFGGQGSTSALASYRPGSIDTVIASLLVGFEVSSDVGMTTTGGVKFTYKHSADSTENAPQWVVKDRMLGAKDHVLSKPAPPAFEKKDVKAGETAAHVYAVISLCTPAGIYDFLRVEVAGDGAIKEKIAAATERAQNAFWENTMAITTDMAKRRIDKESPFGAFENELFKNDEKPTLKVVIKKINEAYANTVFERGDRKPVVTLTVTYFGGEKDKEAADKLGIKGVAMEDYHVLRVLRSAVAKGILEKSAYPIILDWRVDRINCDPKSLPAGVEAKFNAFYATTEKSKEVLTERLLSIDDYVKVIIWGLRGVLRGDVSANVNLKKCLDWKYAKTISAESRPEYFWSFIGDVGGADFFIPDPFCIEIATDFINELAEMEMTGDKDPGIASLTNAGGRKEKARKLAEAVQNAWLEEDKPRMTPDNAYGEGHLAGTKAKIVELMTHLHQNCSFGVGDLAVQVGESKVKTWLRPGGKWSGVGAIATLQEAANKNKFEAAAIDRAFYKSSNMMALQTFADYGLWE